MGKHHHTQSQRSKPCKQPLLISVTLLFNFLFAPNWKPEGAVFVPPPPSSHRPQIFETTTFILLIEACVCVCHCFYPCWCVRPQWLLHVKGNPRQRGIQPFHQSDASCAPASSRYIIIQCLTRGDTEPTKQRGGQAPAVNGAWLCMGGV